MLPMLMTRAGSSGVPAASSSGKNARVMKNGAFRSRSTTLSQAAAGNSSSGAPQVAPALLTSTFKAGSRWPTSPASRRHSASVDRSAGMATICPYWVSSRSAAAQASALRELMYTRAPASSSPRAIISPIPRLPPVTTAVFPDRSNKSMISPMPSQGRNQPCRWAGMRTPPYPAAEGLSQHLAEGLLSDPGHQRIVGRVRQEDQRQRERPPPRSRSGVVVRLAVGLPEDGALLGREQHPGHGQVVRGVTGGEVSEVDHGADLARTDQDVGGVQVAVDPGRWPGPGIRFRGGVPDSTGGPGFGAASYQAEVLGDPAGPARERTAAERIDRCIRWSRDVQRREELAERDGGRGQVIGGRQRGDLAREEGHHAPVPRVTAGGPADPDRRGDRQRKPGSEHGQPALLMHHQFGGKGAPRQPREQVRADRADHVVPPIRQHPQRQAGEIRVLLGQQLPDELNGDIDFRGGHAVNGHHMTIRGLANDPRTRRSGDHLRTSAADVHRRARDRYQRVEERGESYRDPHAAMGGRSARYVGVAVDRVDGTDEKHGVIHLAERHRHPARHEGKGREVAGRCDGVAAAVRRAEVAPAGRGYVADQRDMVVFVEDENLVLQVDLDPQATAMADKYLGPLRAGQGPLHRRTHRIPRVQALRLLECPYGLQGV